jgi:uncharacterized membrane protein YfcA
MLETIIIILSIIQSIFGIGLLVIGTPILLILNYDFFNVLSILLPCSILISILQIYSYNTKNNINKDVIILSIPLIILGTFIIFTYKLYINFKIFIGFGIFFVLSVKFFLKKNFIGILIKKNNEIIFMLIGLFHGLTNAGGTLISIYFQEILKKDKNLLRLHIAFSYLVFASTQYILINILSNEIVFNLKNLEILLLSAGSYMVGKRVFLYLSFKKYLFFLNIMIFLSSFWLILSGLELV